LVSQSKTAIAVVTPYIYKSFIVNRNAVLCSASDLGDVFVVQPFYQDCCMCQIKIIWNQREPAWRSLNIIARLISGDDVFPCPAISQLTFLSVAKRKYFPFISMVFSSTKTRKVTFAGLRQQKGEADPGGGFDDTFFRTVVRRTSDKLERRDLRTNGMPALKPKRSSRQDYEMVNGCTCPKLFTPALQTWP
jgi:hypothetical protein